MSRRLNVLAMLSAGMCSLMLKAAVTPPPSAPIEPNPVLTFKDVETIITDNCQFCHTGADASANVLLDTEADVVALAATIYAAVDSGLMPYGDPDWRQTDDGQKLLKYLKTQIPVEPTPTPAPTLKN